MTVFGPAGNSESFAAMGYKSSLQVPEYLEKMNLDAFEYQCGRGVHISEASAAQLGEAARMKNIRLSIHAPYYISMSSTEEDKRDNSIGYVLQSANAARHMGADRIVVHTGSCGKISREEALALAKDTMKRSLAALDERNWGDIHICPEVMGKTNQLGTLEEVIELCRLDERLIPCVDFGHLNARTFGALKEQADFAAVFNAIEDRLGQERMKTFHVHFSKIEYTGKGGEKRHLTFEDAVFGPDPRLLIREIADRDCSLTVICESAGTQAEDAQVMKEMYQAARQ